VIANPANKYLVVGGGVATAIKKKGSVEIEIKARRHTPIEIGRAVITMTGKLKCRAVIHALTIKHSGGRSTPKHK